MSAFQIWFRINFSKDVTAGAAYLYDCAMKGPSDSVVWQWLEKVGDERYSVETFVKAAKLILEEK
jgi:hypothetical protein